MRRAFFQLLFLLVPAAAHALDDEERALLTETIRSDDGHYALSIDAEAKAVTVVRTDDRAGATPQLRMRLLLAGGGSRVVPLQAEQRAGGSPQFRGTDKSWDGHLTGWALECSRDGRAWTKLVPAKKR